MKRITLALSLSALLFAACSGGPRQATPARPNTLSPAEAAAGWRLLFDGTTTAGWRNYMTDGISGGWQVDAGALTMVGGGGDIITRQEFESFELQLEWKISPKGNSGIMYHVIEGPAATYMTGPEMQVLDNAGHGNGLDPLTSAGACYGLYKPIEDATKPVGEWNAVRLIVDRGHAEHWLNGVKLCEYNLWSADWNKRVADSKFGEWSLFGDAKRGHIALQDHGDRVAYRNIKLREL